jgi:CRISPR-associated endonuclease/helicase Cas3
MTGFTIFADWIASNTDWFPPNIQPDRKIIAAAAHRILTDLGWNSAIASGVSFGQQFLPEDPGSFQPRGIQSALLDMADAPGLYILEAPMGMGKTEAALATAYKRWTEGPERGLYFALPTQLTSNRIHDRISAFLRNTLENPAILTLAHGSAWLGERQARMLSPEDESDESNDTDEALRWYSSTRRALLAPFGTGTIDQALLAILPARFAALRYFGLTGKVVVIDEVHSYDPYMSALIDRLVNYLLKARSTVIVLSATLTAERRGELIAAAGAVESNPPLSYPLITKVGAGSKTAVHVPVDCDTPPKTIRLSHHTLYPETEDNFWCRVASQVEEGANIVILRNTVALAQQTFNRLKSFVTERISDHHVGLIHSRFPHWQRQENEEKWVRFLGKGDAQRPPGSLLVSTQIVEQSVDIDADILVTDLAPTDLILQRIGRLHRHSRSRASGFEHATCHILHPPTDWQGSERAVKEQLTPHHFIYPALTLWQASCHLRSRESIDLPDDVRQTLETASGLRPGHDSSPAVIAFYESFQRECDTQTGTAKTRDVFNQSAIDDKEGVETRYGVQPTARLVLIQSYPEERDGVITLKPYQGSPVRFNPAEFSSRLAETLHLNAARIPSYLVRNQLIHSPAWLKQHLSDAVLAIVSDDTSELGIVPDRPSPFVLYYHPTQGILYEKKADKVALAEPEDFWF